MKSFRTIVPPAETNGTANGNTTPKPRTQDELKINTNLQRAPNDDDNDELTPDSMSSRLVDSAVAVGIDEALLRGGSVGDLVFDRMSSRMAN